MAFCPKIELFLIRVFHRNSIRKHLFLYCGKKRMILSGKNWSFKKGQKMDIFQRIMDYLQKLNFLLWLFFTEIMSGKIVFRYSGKKTNIVRPKNWRLNKGQKIGPFFKGVSPCMLFKNRSFSYRRFSQEFLSENNVFDIVERKEWY